MNGYRFKNFNLTFYKLFCSFSPQVFSQTSEFFSCDTNKLLALEPIIWEQALKRDKNTFPGSKNKKFTLNENFIATYLPKEKVIISIIINQHKNIQNTENENTLSTVRLENYLLLFFSHQFSFRKKRCLKPTRFPIQFLGRWSELAKNWLNMCWIINFYN